MVLRLPCGPGSLGLASLCALPSPVSYACRSILRGCDDLTATVVAELVSAYPTAGGMYFVTKFVTPERHVPLAAWIIGWANFLGQTAGVASVGYSVGQMLLAAAAMGSGYDETTGTFGYTP